MRILFLLVLLGPLTSYGQYKLSGVVRDSVTQELIPGVSVIIKTQAKGAVTNSLGEFEIESNTLGAEVTFSFPGLKTKTQVIKAGDKTIIALSIDRQLLEENPDYFVKTSLDLGYFGDKDRAPMGVIINYSLQAIGGTSLDMNSNFKYWKNGGNSALEFSISKDLTYKINCLPDNLFLSYKSINYGDREFNLKQTRGVISNELRRFFAVDIGVAYNDLIQNDEQGLTNEQYFTGIIGLTKIFSFDSFLKNWGFYSSINYNPNRTMYQVGTYKGVYIKKLPAIVLMAKYYDYGTFDGILLSIRFKVFSTRYYCCHSWKVYYDDINVLK